MQTYTVQHGDSVSKISKLLYGDLSKTQEICKINKIFDCNMIQVGQVLSVPDPTNVSDAQVLSDSSSAKSTFAKWFPWLFVAGAAYLLGREAMKQHKKNKSAKASTPALGNHDKKYVTDVYKGSALYKEINSNNDKEQLKNKARHIKMAVKSHTDKGQKKFFSDALKHVNKKLAKA